jgi:DNA-binding XRE family transcriptional regulator
MQLTLDNRSFVGDNRRMMTPESLRAWRQRMRWSKATAADALGLSITGYFQYETGKPLAGKKEPRPIPKTVALACAAITHRLPPEE